MSRLVGAASDRSRGSGQARAPASQVSDVAAVIDAVVQDLRPALDLRLQSLAVAVPAGPIAVCGETERLAQVVTNLLDNASKYTPDRGAIRLGVVVEGASVLLTVADDGIGIAPAAVPGIFEPFGHDSHALGFGGVSLGIGLPVVRALVQELGGTVAAESAGPGRGSHFVVTLPLAGAVPADPADPALPGDPDSLRVGP